MRKNFMNLYQVDIDEYSNFDFVLDTTALSSEEVFERVSSFIDLQIAWIVSLVYKRRGELLSMKHLIGILKIIFTYAPVAQLDRATAF